MEFSLDDTNSHTDALHLTDCIMIRGAYTSLIRPFVRYTQMAVWCCADTIAKRIRIMVGLGIWERLVGNHKIKMPCGIKDEALENDSLCFNQCWRFVRYRHDKRKTNTPQQS
jgi:hypothetical protein